MPVVGIDIGTQSLKAVIADAKLSLLGEGNVGYLPSFPRPGWAEQDPRLWLAALGPAIAAALQAARCRPEDIEGIAIAGQLDGCIPTANGRALGPCVIWMDRRADGLLDKIDPALVSHRAGLVLDATHMAAKIGWLTDNMADADKVEVWHQPVSFVLEALTGSRLIDHGTASTTMVYGLEKQGYDDVLMDAFGIDVAELPAVAPAESLAGTLSAAGAALTGLRTGTAVAVGTGDDFSNLIGAGLAEPGTATAALGTAEVVGALSEDAIVDPDMLVETHLYPGGRYVLSNPGWLSGGAISWFLDTFSVETPEAMSALAQTAPAGSDDLIFLPALSGAMAPRWVAGARGAFYGLTPAHGKAHCARAVLEGTAFAMLDVLDRLRALNVPLSRLRLMGGGARSATWARIRADMSGLPTEICTGAHVSPMGAAVLATVAAGIHENVSAALSSMQIPMTTIEPDTQAEAVYRDAHARYRTLFDALSPLYE